MNLYVIEFFILCFNAFIYHGLKEKRKKYIYILGCLQLLLLTICRSPIDANWADTQQYLNYFNYFSSSISWDAAMKVGWEPGIVILTRIIGSFSNTSQIYIIVLGIFILLPIFLMIWKYSYYPCISLIIFYSMGMLISTSIYRQWCAIAILSYSLKYIYEKKFVPFFMLVIIAFLFHRTAAVFLIVYFIYNIKVSMKYIIFLFFFSLSLIIVGPRLLPFLNLFARTKESISFNGGITLYVILWIVVLISYIICSKYIESDQIYRLSFNMVLFAAVLQPISFAFSNWSRIILYFSMFMFILLPNTIYYLENKNYNNKRLSVLIELIFLIFMFIWFLNDVPNEYISIWR